VLDTIAAELRSQYSIGYYPTHPPKDGRWHSVKIRMKNPDYVARGRKEYLDTALPPSTGKPSPTKVAAPKYTGRVLEDVLRELQATGLNIVFSSEIVQPTLRVLAEPKATAPRKILDEILNQHALEIRSGPGGTLLVVRARLAYYLSPCPPEPQGRRTVQCDAIELAQIRRDSVGTSDEISRPPFHVDGSARRGAACPGC